MRHCVQRGVSVENHIGLYYRGMPEFISSQDCTLLTTHALDVSNDRYAMCVWCSFSKLSLRD